MLETPKAIRTTQLLVERFDNLVDNNGQSASKLREFMKDIDIELVKLKENLGRLPTKRDKPYLYNLAVKKYGSWNKALEHLFGEVTRIYSTDKESILLEMQNFLLLNGRKPKATDNTGLTSSAQRYFGSWNQAMKLAFGSKNQERYDKDVWKTVVDFIKKYQRLPLREEFNGKEFPYWQAITNSLDCTKWSDIFSKIDLTGVTYFNSSSHGTGRIFIYKDVVFLSHQEYLIGKYLLDSNIEFDKEVPYGNCNYIFDFYLPKFDIYIEYFGLSNRDFYIKRIEEKRKFYSGRKVIEIFKHDNTLNKLDQEVQRL